MDYRPEKGEFIAGCPDVKGPVPQSVSMSCVFKLPQGQFPSQQTLSYMPTHSSKPNAHEFIAYTG